MEAPEADGEAIELSGPDPEPRRTELPERPSRKARRGQVPEKRHQAFIDYQTEILRFARLVEVPFTNHRNEPGLRMAKTKPKVSSPFRTLPHAQPMIVSPAT